MTLSFFFGSTFLASSFFGVVSEFDVELETLDLAFLGFCFLVDSRELSESELLESLPEEAEEDDEEEDEELDELSELSLLEDVPLEDELPEDESSELLSCVKM